MEGAVARPSVRPTVSPPEASDKPSWGTDNENLLRMLASPTSAASSKNLSTTQYLTLLSGLLLFVSLPLLASLAAHLSPRYVAPLLGLHVGSDLTPAVCQPGMALAPEHLASLPKLYFVAGVEGSGHEVLARVFELVKNRANVSIAPLDVDLHLTSSQGQVVDASKSNQKKFKLCPKLPYSRQVYDFGVEITSRLAALQDTTGVPFRGLYVRTQDTFPMGTVHTPLARPDLVALALFHGIMYSLKVLVLVRDPAEVMKQRIKNGSSYASDSGLLFRILEDSLVYLDASVRQLPCGTYAAVNMDLLQSAAVEWDVQTAEALSKFLDIDGVGTVEIAAYLQKALASEEGEGGGGKEKASSEKRRRLSGDVATIQETQTEQLVAANGTATAATVDTATPGMLISTLGNAAEGSVSSESSAPGGRRRRLKEQSGVESPEDPKALEERESNKWLEELEDKTTLRRNLWPLLSALERVGIFHPRYPSQWPEFTWN